MGFDIFNLVSQFRIRLHDVLHHVFSLLVDVAWDEILTTENLFVKFVRVRVLKRQIANCHRVEYYAEGPKISIQTMVALACYHFRRGVARTATRRLQSVPLLLVCVTQTEIDNLNIHILVEQQILWFQVAMAYFDFVQVFNTSENLMKEAAGFTVLQPALLDNVLEKLASTSILHNQKELL